MFKRGKPTLNETQRMSKPPDRNKVTTLVIDPITIAAAPGATTHAAVRAYNYKGQQLALPPGLVVTVADPTVASGALAAGDLAVTGTVAGATTVTVSTAMVRSNPASVTVPDVVAVASLSLSAPVGTLSIGATQHVTITARNAQGDPVPVPADTVISNSNPTVASTIRVDADVAVLGLAAGLTTLRAISGVIQSNAVSASVADPTVVTSLTVVPSILSLVVGDVGHATVTARNYLMNVIALPVGMTVTSTNPSAASVVLTGNDLAITALAAGVTSLVVHAGALASNALAATVTSVPVVLVPTSLRVVPSSLTPVAGSTIGFTVRVLDQNGSNFPLAGASIALVDDLGSGGVFTATPIVTGSDGATTGTFTVSSDAAVNHRIAASAAGGLAGVSAIIDVQIASTSDDTPPVFVVGDTLGFTEDFESGMSAHDRWLAKGSVFPLFAQTDFGEEPTRNLIVSPGLRGSNYMSRLVFDGIYQEGHAWIIDGPPVPVGRAKYYYEYDAQVILASPLPLGGDGSDMPFKWFMAFHPDGSRYQFNTHYSWGGGPGSSVAPRGCLWMGMERSTLTTDSNGAQPVGPFATDVFNEGLVHKYRYMYLPNSAPGARDGQSAMWVDDNKIIDIRAETVGVRPSGGWKDWCMMEDVDAIDTQVVNFNKFVSDLTNNTPAFTVDIDNYRHWFRPVSP